MARQDNRLTDGAPMQPLGCPRCGNQVLVRKSSWHQTSVQWTTAAMEGCPERQASASGGGNGGGFTGCEALRAAIRDAAVTGALHVPED
ncbi:ferredoxin [Streptomyces triticisoli]|jgi:hypothetical protein|uniref:ferredoxin n=1 Tax=Streptomyces triticisoli TaxID=2182797 RepID=UPI000DD7DE6A|nr:ferredoxin [Streptomyces triticisoli]